MSTATIDEMRAAMIARVTELLRGAPPLTEAQVQACAAAIDRALRGRVAS